MLLEMMEETKDFLLGEERGTGHATMFGETVDPSEVALLGAFPESFKLD
ncbi:hypothetical protein BH11VER1_BH11VER1_35900 [soil metagenome]